MAVGAAVGLGLAVGVAVGVAVAVAVAVADAVGVGDDGTVKVGGIVAEGVGDAVGVGGGESQATRNLLIAARPARRRNLRRSSVQGSDVPVTVGCLSLGLGAE